MPRPFTSVILCLNPNDPQHPHVQVWGNKFCTICGSLITLKKRYIPLQKLGSGGFAVIYTVWDLQTQTERVLKVMVEPSPKARELFQQEATILQSLRHRAVPKVDPDGYFQLTLGNPPIQLLPCLVMEKINGQTLEEILANYPQGCPEAMVKNWFRQAVEILRLLHRRRLIHRDLKPSNLMLRQKTNQLVLIDFGGAKKIRSPLSWSKNSTRLYSPGYSPPEQTQGRDVEPAADFYALGRTMIQLLSGKSPIELEDLRTGKLCWRHLARVSPEFADLLDDLVRQDVRQRLTNAARIQKRLSQSSPQPQQQKSTLQKINLLGSSKRFTRTAHFLLKLLAHIGHACLDTIKAMVLSAIAAWVGTTAGFILAYWSPLSATVANFISQRLPQLMPNPQIAVAAEMIIVATVGLTTAWGLTAAGGFGQRQRYFISPLIGLCSYVLSWLLWLAIPAYMSPWGVVGLIAFAVTILTLSLGLRRHYQVHALVTSVGTATVFTVLVSLNIFPAIIVYIQPSPALINFWLYTVFFSFISITLSFWLGISYYLVLPCLRWLGWCYAKKDED